MSDVEDQTGYEEPPRRRAYEDDEDDDEEEEEEEEELPGKKKRRHKKDPSTRFLDIEAEVSDEEEEEEDDDDFANDPFIETAETAGEDDGRHHARLDKRRELEEDEKSPEQIAREFSERYNTRVPSRFTGDMNEIPQRLLMPSVHDASLWQIRVKVSSFCFFIYLF